MSRFDQAVKLRPYETDGFKVGERRTLGEYNLEGPLKKFDGVYIMTSRDNFLFVAKHPAKQNIIREYKINVWMAFKTPDNELRFSEHERTVEEIVMGDPRYDYYLEFLEAGL